MRNACRHVQATLSPAYPSDLGELERAHVDECRLCRSVGNALAYVPTAILAQAGPPLDDIARESILRDMGAALDEMCARMSQPVSSRSRGGAIAAATLLAAAAALAVAWQLRRAPEAPGATTASAPAPVSLPALVPISVEGELAQQPTARSLVGTAVSALSVPARSRVRATIAGAEIEVRGPSELSIAADVVGGWQLTLQGGELIAVTEERAAPIAVRVDNSRVVVASGAFIVRDLDAAPQVSLLRGTASLDGRPIPAGSDLSPPDRAAIEALVAPRRDPPDTDRAPSVQLERTAPEPAPREPLTREPSPLAPAPRAPAPLAPAPRETMAREQRAAEQAATAREQRGAEQAATAREQRGAEQAATAREQRAAEQAAPEPVPAEPPKTPTASELYRQAEEALHAGRRDRAAILFRTLADDYPDDSLADDALYDLARLAVRRGRRAEARRAIDRLLADDRPTPLREPAAWLRCQLSAGEERARCEREFRQEYPASPHSSGERSR